MMAKKLSVECNNASPVSGSPNSCISEDLTMIRAEICSSNLQAALEPCLKDADKQHLDDAGNGDEKTLRGECIKLSIMLVLMVSASVAVLVPEASPVLLSSLHSHFLVSSTELCAYVPQLFKDFHSHFLVWYTELCAYVPQVFKGFQGIWTKLQIPGSQIHLALAGTVIGLIFLGLRYFSLFIRRNSNKPTVFAAVEESIQDVNAETPSESGSSEHITPEKTPCSEKQGPPSSPLEDSPMPWKPICKPEVSLILEYEYSPAEMSASEKKVTHVQSFLTRDDTVQRPERRSRRRSMVPPVIQNAVAEEISVGSSPSGNFVADERETSAGENQMQVGSAPLRRSSRLRNQALSPPSASRMLILSRG